MKKIGIFSQVAFVVTIMLSGAYGQHTASMNAILLTYANIANLNYADTLNDAKALQKSVQEFTKNPSLSTLDSAKKAWIASRESFGQTEVFRLSNGPIDAEEGWVFETYAARDNQINAWPLDENMIDYTIDAKGKRTSGNIIDSKGIFNPGGEESTAVNVDKITMKSISALNENGGKANVATGYHAVEFLLWGQDQDYANFLKDGVSHGALTAGQRPLSDYVGDKNAQRRKDYLNAVTAKIVADLATVASAWDKDTGVYRKAFLGKGKHAIRPHDALKHVFTGMGMFIKSEVANERIGVAVLTPSEEDEQSCFSDNTHRDIATNYQGLKNILSGTYKGKKIGVAPLDNLDAKHKETIMALMHKIENKIKSIDTVAKTSRHFDYQIRPDDTQVKVIVKLKNEMRKLGDKMMDIAFDNGVNL